VLGVKVVSEIIWLEVRLEASGVTVVSEGVKLSVSGFKVVSETVGLEVIMAVDEGGLFCVTLLVVSSTAAEMIWLESEFFIVGVKLEVMKVRLGVEISLTIVVDNGGLVCVTFLVGSIVVSEIVGLATEVPIGYGTVELETSGFKVV